MNAEEIFHRAAEIEDPSGRAAYLDQACRADATLRAEVESLLKAHDKAGSFLEGTPAGVTVESPARTEGPGTRIGRYDLLELLGEGGMGLVYLAQQQEPVKRRVALKIIKPGMDSKQVIARFEAERQALALLDHPNIAHVFDAGCTETGRPYFVMEQVKGMSITRYCDEHKLDIEQRLRLFEQVCEAVQHAHQKGIIHRDLKPSNILVTLQGDRPVPKIIDFGIAKATSQSLTEGTMFTYQGQFLGTPEYMSPEQADLGTQDIDTRSDIYSLGVVLYELLAGVLPFEAESFTKVGLAEIQRTIREQEPASPSARLTQMGDKAKVIAESRGTQVVPLARRLHRELEWIPLKAMRKDRCRRYRSASEMADDIRNYLTGLPLIAGPETTIYRVQKFVHKHAGSVATGALVAVAIILGLVVSTAMYFRAEDARQKEAVARTRAEQAEGTAKDRSEELRRTLYVNNIQLADAKYREGNICRVHELLASCPNDLRGWEWDRLDHIADQSTLAFVAYPEHEHVNGLAVSPDGKQVVTGGWQAIKIWDALSGSELMTIPTGNRGEITCVALSPDGKWIASGEDSGQVSIWDAATGNQESTIKAHLHDVSSVAFSPDGERIVSCSYDGIGKAKVWDVADGAEVMAVPAPSGDTFFWAAFSTDGKKIVAASNRHEKVTILDASDGRELIVFTGTAPVSFAPDGKLVAVADSHNDINLWDSAAGRKIVSLRGHEGPIESVAFSADGKHVASGSMDNTVKLWDVSTGETLMTLRGHEYYVSCIGFTPDGKRIISGSWDGTVRIWDATTSREVTSLIGHNDLVHSLAYSPDGKRIASGSSNGVVKPWDVENGAEVVTLRHSAGGGGSGSVAFSPDGRRVISGCNWRPTRVWDAATGVEALTIGGRDNAGRPVAFSPDGKHVASGNKDKTVKVWDAIGGQEVMTLKGHASPVTCVAFSPDGRFIASGSWDPNIKVWDWLTGREFMSLRGHEGIITSVAFSPDGKRIVSSCQRDCTVKLWDAMTGTETITLKHADIVVSAAFSPDGTRIISGCRDRTVRVWDATTGAELLTLRAGSGVTGVAFSPDGKTIACGTFAGTVTLWESAPPAHRYETRRHGVVARRIVDEMYAKHGYYHAVVRGLQEDMTLDGSVRKLAMRIANSRKWEDGDKLTKEVWGAVSLADKDTTTYQEALAKADKANGWEPNEPAVLTTLGAAQYRTDSYEEALKTLTRAEKLRADTGEEQAPAILAFTAMSLHRLGQADKAKATLEQLRGLLKEEGLADDHEAKALLAEAEGLITGTRQ